MTTDPTGADLREFVPLEPEHELPATRRVLEDEQAIAPFEPHHTGLVDKYVATGHGLQHYQRYARRAGFTSHNLFGLAGWAFRAVDRLANAVQELRLGQGGYAQPEQPAQASTTVDVEALERRLLELHRRLVKVEQVSVVKVGLHSNEPAPPARRSGKGKAPKPDDPAEA